MRHILAHHYGAVNLDKVYEVVEERLPELLKCLQLLIPQLERDTRWSDGGTG